MAGMLDPCVTGSAADHDWAPTGLFSDRCRRAGCGAVRYIERLQRHADANMAHFRERQEREAMLARGRAEEMAEETAAQKLLPAPSSAPSSAPVGESSGVEAVEMLPMVVSALWWLLTRKK